MADNFGKWQGGPNFVYAQQWGTGQTNGGEGNKKFGSAGMKRGNTYRFNPNVTRTSHAGCQIAQQSRRDKDAFMKRKEMQNG